VNEWFAEGNLKRYRKKV